MVPQLNPQVQLQIQNSNWSTLCVGFESDSDPSQLTRSSQLNAHWRCGAGARIRAVRSNPTPAARRLPPPLRACACARAGAEQAQWEVTSVTTFKRLPLRALIASRAAAPGVAMVSPFSCLARPWQGDGPRSTVSLRPLFSLPPRLLKLLQLLLGTLYTPLSFAKHPRCLV